MSLFLLSWSVHELPKTKATRCTSGIDMFEDLEAPGLMKWRSYILEEMGC